MNGRLLGKEGREFAHKALELMDQFDVAPTPENYAVWICFASDTNPELCETLRTHIEAGEAFSETAEPARQARIELLAHERRLAAMVERAYGLTDEEIALMWRTAPPRMPLAPPPSLDLRPLTAEKVSDPFR